MLNTEIVTKMASNMAAEWDSDDDLPLNNNKWDSDDEVPLVEGHGNEDDDDDGNDINLPEDLGNMWTANVTDSIRIQNFTRNVGSTHILSADKKELDFFGRMFPMDMLVQIAAETNRYAAESQRKSQRTDVLWEDTRPTEIQAYLGIIGAMSVCNLPNYKLYWQSEWPFTLPAFKGIFIRSRFEKLNQYFHLHDARNNPPKGAPGHDMLCHVRPLLDRVSTACLMEYNPSKENSIDEAMIPFKGRLSVKQYLPAKPTKFGIKVWERADGNNGFVSEFQVYTGRKINVDGTRTSETGLGARVVTDLTRSLVGGHYHIYMDNYFTGIPLFKELLNDGLYACGTIKSNRKGWPSAFHPKLLKNQDDYQVRQLGKTNLVATCWHDKRQVNVLGTNSTPKEIVNIERRQKTGEVKIVPAPVSVQNYQAYMNGVDHADQLRMQYTCTRKSRKYWKYIYYFLLDICIVNAFLLMKMSPNHVLASKTGRVKQREHLDFR